MGSLGEKLKAARESKGLELAAISEKTRISRTFLQALEDEDFSVIPGDVFVRGFLRTYARELGLKEKEVMALYGELTAPRPPAQQAAPGQEAAAPSMPLQAPERPEPGQEKPSPAPADIAGRPTVNRALLWLLMAAAALAGISAYLIMDTGAPVEEQAAPPAVKERAFTAVTAQPATNAPPPAADAAGEAAPKPPPAPEEEKKAPLVLKLTALGDTWYSYRADDVKAVSGILYRGRSIEVQAEKSISLDLGNAGGAKVEFNGKELKPLGRTGAVVKGILFTADYPDMAPPKREEARPTDGVQR